MKRSLPAAGYFANALKHVDLIVRQLEASGFDRDTARCDLNFGLLCCGY